MIDSIYKSFEKLIQLENYIQGELSTRDTVSSVVCGGISGMIAKTVVAPAERIKMSFQVTMDRFTFAAALERGRSVVHNYGIIGLWRGHSTTLLRVAPFAGISYATHDYAEDIFKTGSNRELYRQFPYVYNFLAGSIAGAVGTVCTYPLDVLRIRLALTPHLTWSSAVAQGRFYRGLSPTLLGIVPYSGMTWCVKQSLRELFPLLTDREPVLIELLSINAVAGLFGQLVTYPLDIVRRRMQMDLGTQPPLSIRGFLRELYRSEGLRGLFKGYSLNILKGPITLSISLTSYEYLRKWTSQRR